MYFSKEITPPGWNTCASFPGLKSGGNQATRAREEREAINAPIQGTAADIMKIAMRHVDTALTENGLQGHILLQVHDELVLECPQKELKRQL
jgi:DNA polymerase-1